MAIRHRQLPNLFVLPSPPPDQSSSLSFRAVLRPKVRIAFQSPGPFLDFFILPSLCFSVVHRLREDTILLADAALPTFLTRPSTHKSAEANSSGARFRLVGFDRCWRIASPWLLLAPRLPILHCGRGIQDRIDHPRQAGTFHLHLTAALTTREQSVSVIDLDKDLNSIYSPATVARWTRSPPWDTLYRINFANTNLGS